MNFNITHFQIDTFLPAVQTLAVSATTEVLGRLGHYKVSPQTAVLVSTVASVFASFVNNFTSNYIARYAAILMGVLAGIGAHRFFYQGTPTQAVLDTKGIIIVSLVLASVKASFDLYNRYQSKVQVPGTNVTVTTPVTTPVATPLTPVTVIDPATPGLTTTTVTLPATTVTIPLTT